MMVLSQNQFIDILAYILLGILGLYVILFFVPFIFALANNRLVEKKARSINLLFLQKLSVLDDLNKKGNEKEIIDIEINKELIKHNQFLLNKKEVISKEEASEIDKIQLKLLSLLEENKTTLEQSNNILSELSDIYRKDIAYYNSVVGAYNYWINILPYKWVFKLFRFKNKTIIS